MGNQPNAGNIRRSDFVNQIRDVVGAPVFADVSGASVAISGTGVGAGRYYEISTTWSFNQNVGGFVVDDIGNLTIPISGKYRITHQASCIQSAAGNYWLFGRLNNAPTFTSLSALCYNTNTGYVPMTMNYIWSLNKGDVVSFYLRDDTATARTFTISYPKTTIELLSNKPTGIPLPPPYDELKSVVDALSKGTNEPAYGIWTGMYDTDNRKIYKKTISGVLVSAASITIPVFSSSDAPKIYKLIRIDGCMWDGTKPTANKVTLPMSTVNATSGGWGYQYLTSGGSLSISLQSFAQGTDNYELTLYYTWI